MDAATAAPMVDGFGVAALRAGVALLMVAGAILLVAWVARRVRSGVQGTHGWFRVRASTALGARERVMLVEAAGAHLLLAVTPGQVRVLHVYDARPELPEAVPAGDFAARLREYLPVART